MWKTLDPVYPLVYKRRGFAGLNRCFKGRSEKAQIPFLGQMNESTSQKPSDLPKCELLASQLVDIVDG